MDDHKDDDLIVTTEEDDRKLLEEAAQKLKADAEKFAKTAKGPPLGGRSVDAFEQIKPKDPDLMRAKIADSECEHGNRAVVHLANEGNRDCRDLMEMADGFEQERASELGISYSKYRKAIEDAIKARPAKVVLGSDRDPNESAIEYRKNYHIQTLKRLVARHLDVSEELLSDYDIEKISAQLCPVPSHVPISPYNGVTEIELGFQDLIEQMDQQVENKFKPEPTVATQVVETAVEVKTEVSSVLDSLQARAKGALDELATTAKRNLGTLLRKSAEYALNRVEKRERYLSDREIEQLKDLVANSHGTKAEIEDIARFAKGIEELEPIVKNLGEAQASLDKILRARGLSGVKVVPLSAEDSVKLLNEDDEGKMNEIIERAISEEDDG